MLFSLIHTPSKAEGPAAGKEFIERAKELGVTECPACGKILIKKSVRKTNKRR